MLNRQEVLDKAIHDCYREMYAKAQPSADWDQIVQEFKDGKRDKDERVYEQHYLSQEEYTYIVEKYLNAYNILSHWKEDVEVVEEYLREGGSKDKYIPNNLQLVVDTIDKYNNDETTDDFVNKSNVEDENKD